LGQFDQNNLKETHTHTRVIGTSVKCQKLGNVVLKHLKKAFD